MDSALVWDSTLGTNPRKRKYHLRRGQTPNYASCCITSYL